LNIAKRVTMGCAIVVLLYQAVSAQQNTDGQLPITTLDRPFLFLIRDPVVIDQLTLDDKQRDELSSLNDELDRDLLSMRNKSPKFVGETLTRVRETAEARLATVLTPAQLERLGQIELWTLGTRGLVSDRLSKALQMSESQVSQVRAILQETRSTVDELSKKLQAGESRESIEGRVRKERTDEQRKILAVLTRRQQQQWMSLLGKRLDLSKLGRVKFKAPELFGARQEWVNSPPLSLEQLKGKVVALHFYAFA
jgi:plasmid stabilization system protein ParE